jgi:hypothetical protein
MSDRDEGVARLESTLAGTRVNAERALRELYASMRRDVRRAERRAERAERRAAELRTELRQARRRLRRAEQAAGATQPPTGLRRLAGGVVRRLPGAGRRA